MKQRCHMVRQEVGSESVLPDTCEPKASSQIGHVNGDWIKSYFNFGTVGTIGL